MPCAKFADEINRRSRLCVLFFAMMWILVLVVTIRAVLHDACTVDEAVFLWVVTWVIAMGAAGLAASFRKIFFIRCPNCRGNIFKPEYAALAMTTGKCGHCGSVVVLPRDACDPPPVLTRAEFCAKDPASRRRMIEGGVLFVILMLFLNGALRDDIAGFVAQPVYDLAGMRWNVLSGVVFFLITGRLVWLLSCSRRRCPYCHKHVFCIPLVLATRRCTKCGAMILRDEA